MIHLLFTGGTISMQRDERAGGNVPTHGGAALAALAPELPDVAAFRIDDWGRYPACHMGLPKLWELREHVRAVSGGEGYPAGEPPQGIVIAHGTDTIEDSAYLLGRTLDPRTPVVITGAMRTSDDPGWDGRRNLTDAARVAAHPDSEGRGTMVVFAGHIFAGTEVAKTHATDDDAFEAPHGGPIGAVHEGRVHFFRPASSRRPLPAGRPTARVAHVPMVVGDEGELLDLARPTHDGVVIVAFGSGNLPPGAVPAIDRWLVDGKPAVLASRCLRGEVTPAYAFPGGGATLVRRGVTPAGTRTPAQARMELTLALSAGIPYGGDAPRRAATP